ncbi:MAG: hypothetical protein KDJ20_01875, partial [Hyphomicrobiales bacterium]|nr:hypothetical protein [Hyphomicrobiales bacterium]
MRSVVIAIVIDDTIVATFGNAVGRDRMSPDEISRRGSEARIELRGSIELRRISEHTCALKPSGKADSSKAAHRGPKGHPQLVIVRANPLIDCFKRLFRQRLKPIIPDRIEIDHIEAG